MSTPTGDRQRLFADGNAILRGREASLEEILNLAERARDLRAFSLARKLFDVARHQPAASQLEHRRRLEVIQQHAVCTYKDTDLPADERYRRAFDILNEGDLNEDNPSRDTLGIAGSIQKAQWRASGQRRDLERSLHFYEMGASRPFAGDAGYLRINAAFVLDLLAWKEQEYSPETARIRRDRARSLREEILRELPKLAAAKDPASQKSPFWFGATMAEACFGLGRFEDARFWLREALAHQPPEWQLESATRQLSLLAHAQGVDAEQDSEVWKTLEILVGNSVPALRSINAGKLGLALSGGGFRASLFHIGVLARLAELDVLRHIEVLSCVSGGSIAGAHYYLEVRRLLQEKTDSEITREDYIDLVSRMERDFLAGVQMNLRMRLFGGWVANVRSLFQPGYTRTKYLGELFERHIYSRIKDNAGVRRWLNELWVRPKYAGEEFNPKLDNWRRSAKVPILLLNATTLNTGHNWQFTVSWMGEPPAGASNAVDRNDLLRRMYYSEAPPDHQRMRLGHAVAASACVPALFDPVELDKLYPERTVQLVDGGVHDNQGVGGLLEQECTVIIVSDASGQMNSERAPSGEVVAVPGRSNSILMSRVREAEYREVDALQRSSALNGLLFLHLKTDLDMTHVDWIGCQDPFDAFDETGGARRSRILTRYGVPKTVQEKLAGLRTDLDSFSESEAFSLMLSGYRMTEMEFASCLPEFPINEAPAQSWNFLAVAPTMDRAAGFERDQDRLVRLLEIGADRGFKLWRAKPALAAVALIFLTAGLYFGATRWFGPLKQSINARYIAVALLVIVFLSLVPRLSGVRKNFTILVTGWLFVTIGWMGAWIHLLFFDHWFLRAGAVRRDSEAGKPRGRARDGVAAGSDAIK